MVFIQPVRHAIVPADSQAADRLGAPNYDEFQSDKEVWELLQQRPKSILRVTMPHCVAKNASEMLAENSLAALEAARERYLELQRSPEVRHVHNVLWVYSITSPKRPAAPQFGLGGMARTADIRTDETPRGTIIRNEGIHPDKAEGRARLIEKTESYIDSVNCTVQDQGGKLLAAMQRLSGARKCDFETLDEAGNRHAVWLISAAAEVDELTKLLAAEPAAYVADGNHRSAAAATLKKEGFLAVFFTTSCMGLEPYNRLVKECGVPTAELLKRLESQFSVEKLGGLNELRPQRVHELGFYASGNWYRLAVKPTAFDPQNAVETIDADIVQRHVFAGILGLHDARDKRINYVGGNKDSRYLKTRVDAGEYQFALSLAPVTMDQFVAVCEQGRFMPPKSTWFDPKIRSGLVMALFADG